MYKEILPANTAKIQPALVVGTTSGTVYFDNIQTEKTPFTSAYNMVDNPSFDRGTTSADHWVNTTALTISPDSNTKFSGSRSMSISNPNSWAGLAPDYYIAYDPNKAYTLTGFVKGNNLSNPAGAYLKINFYDSNFTQLSPDAVSNKLADATTDWTGLVAHVNANGAPNGTAYIKPVVTAYNFTGTAYFDAIRLQEGNVTTSYEYNAVDANGKGGNNYVTKTTDPLGYSESQTYDSVGNKKTFTDAKQNLTSYTYDNQDRLKSIALPGADLKTIYGYDANGNRTQVKNTNKAETVTYNSINYTYNNLDLISTLIDPLNRVTGYHYDNGGNKTSVDYPNTHTVSYGYNTANRLDKVIYDGATKYTFGYDANGNRTSEIDNGVNKTWVYNFDTANRLWKITAPNGSLQENSYDKNNNRLTQKVTVGASSYNTTNVYSITNKNIEMTDSDQKKSRFAYDEKDNLIQVKSGNGTVANQQFDDSNQVTKILNTKSDGTIISSYSYSYDSNGNRSGIVTNSVSLSYQYDALNQLTQEPCRMDRRYPMYTMI